ncbi:MAG: N-acetylneuraminate synthase family protein [Alphaproteobacteria bacterium]
MESRPYTLIAEVGCNHMGDFDLAKKFIDVAGAFCGVTHIKFQKRNVPELLTPDEYDAPHPVPENSYGATYGAHREYLEFDIDQHRELKAYCEARDIVYGCSVWDMKSLREMVSIEPEQIKIPSATNTHYELLTEMCRTYPGKIHVSLGMTTRSEEERIIRIFREEGRIADVVLYACTSGYPILPEDACLFEITRLIEAYGDETESIGYSGHHNGIALDVAAFTLGAEVIERHFTLDRTWKGTDHAASLEPDGLRRLERNLHYTAAALHNKPEEILEIEKPQRAKLKWLKGEDQA